MKNRQVSWLVPDLTPALPVVIYSGDAVSRILTVAGAAPVSYRIPY
ncbi:hypothetical protein JOD44_002431 [Salimicrobium jeotgali]|nr:hypothetical protein [Salimicrobium jeotgali]